MSLKKRRREEDGDVQLERKPVACRITYHVDERVFDRVFNEDSLDEMKHVIRRKLKLPNVELELAQLRDDVEVDLEDDDDFESLKMQAQIDDRIDVLVTVVDAPPDWSFARAATPGPDASFERARSVEPVAAMRRRSMSVGTSNRGHVPAIANLMRAKNLIPYGAAVFDDDDEDDEEPTLGELATRTQKRMSAGTSKAAAAGRQATETARSAADEVAETVEGAGKKVAKVAKTAGKATKESGPLQTAGEALSAAGKSILEVGKSASTLVQEAGEAASGLVAGAAKAAKRTIQPAEDAPPAKRRKKQSAGETVDVSMTNAAPQSEEVGGTPEAAPTKPKPKPRKSKSSLAPDAARPTSNASTNKPGTSGTTATQAPTSAATATITVPSFETGKLNDLDPVARILARAALSQKSQADQKAAKKAQRSKTIEQKAEEKAQKVEEKKTQKAEEKARKAAEKAQNPKKRKSKAPAEGEASDAQGGAATTQLAADPADKDEASGATKEKKKRAKKLKSKDAESALAESVPPAAGEGATGDGTQAEKKDRKKNDFVQNQDNPDGGPKSEEERDGSEEVKEVASQRQFRRETDPGPSEDTPESPKQTRTEDGPANASRHNKDASKDRRNRISASNASSTPRSSAFLERLVESSTPARQTSGQSPVNSVVFPAQVLRPTSTSSTAPSSTPRRFQAALGQGQGTRVQRDGQDDITEFTQPSMGLSQTVNPPQAPGTAGKPLRPLSKLPRPSLTNTPGLRSASSSPTGPPVPSPTTTKGPSITIPTARQPTMSPILGQKGDTPRASPLPTWTALRQPSSSDQSPVDPNASQVDQLRSSSTGAVSDISRPNSAVTREEELEVERATQEMRYDEEDEDGFHVFDGDGEGTTTDDRTKAGDGGSDEEDNIAAPQPRKRGSLGPPAQILSSADLDATHQPQASVQVSITTITAQQTAAPPNLLQPSSSPAAKSSPASKPGSNSSLISYPSLPTPKAASQPLFRPETQLPSQSVPGTYPSASAPAPVPLPLAQQEQEEDHSLFGLGTQYVGLSQLSKDKLRQSMSRSSLSLSSRANGKPNGQGAGTSHRSPPKRAEQESETEDEEDEEDEDEEDSDVQDSILPRDRLAGAMAKRARRGRVSAKFF